MASQRSDQSEEAPEAGQAMDLRSIYYALLGKAWLIALCLVASAFVTVAYLKRAPRLYAAQALLRVDPDEAPLLKGIEDFRNGDFPKGQEFLKTVERLLQTQAIFERVIATNHLDTDARFLGRGDGRKPSRADLVAMLGHMVKIGVQAGTRLISVSVEHSNPALTAEIANSIVQEFARQTVEQQSLNFIAVHEYLIVEEENLKKEMEKAEQAVLAFKQKNLSLDLTQDTVGQNRRTFNLQLTEANGELVRKETDYRQIQKLGTNIARLLEVEAVSTDPRVAPFLTQLSQQEIDFANLKLRYKEKHPKYRDAASKLAELKSALTAATLQVVETARNSYEGAKARVAALEKQVKDQEAAVHELDLLRVQFDMKQREAETARSHYELVRKKLAEASIVKELPNNNIRLVQPAYAPEKPIKPKRVKILGLGLMLGLASGVGLAMGLYALDSSLKSPEEAQDFLKLPLLAAIPDVRDLQSRKNRLIMTQETECYESEHFRSLRTALSMLEADGERRSFLFASAVPNEGKSFCAVNYALSLTRQGFRTLFIECDLRCPSLTAELLPTVRRSPGVTDFLAGSQPLDAIIQATDLENFLVIAAGTHRQNPSELLSGPSFSLLLQHALASFDRVVIDSAPVEPVSDTLLLAKYVQTVCLVVRANKTPKRVALRAAEALLKARAPLVGFILNGIDRRRVTYYDDYAYRPEFAPGK